jgi:diadenylate cyclase
LIELLAEKILSASERARYFLENLKVSSSPLFIFDILIVAFLFYYVFIFLKETRAMRILYGFLFLIVLMALGNLLNLALLNWILKSLMAMLVVAIPVVFQPELRAVLERVGRSRFLGEKVFYKEDYGVVVAEVIATAKYLSEKKIGALIIFQRSDSLKDYIESGIEVDAKVTTQLLLSIFFPKSPLHDGAAIISGDRVVSARSILPVSDAKLNPDLGMRHKSAVGATENSDAVAIVVSEESGFISLAAYGKLERRISEERLRNRLLGLLRHGKSEQQLGDTVLKEKILKSQLESSVVDKNDK